MTRELPNGWPGPDKHNRYRVLTLGAFRVLLLQKNQSINQMQWIETRPRHPLAFWKPGSRKSQKVGGRAMGWGVLRPWKVSQKENELNSSKWTVWHFYLGVQRRPFEWKVFISRIMWGRTHRNFQQWSPSHTLAQSGRKDVNVTDLSVCLFSIYLFIQSFICSASQQLYPVTCTNWPCTIKIHHLIWIISKDFYTYHPRRLLPDHLRPPFPEVYIIVLASALLFCITIVAVCLRFFWT